MNGITKALSEHPRVRLLHSPTPLEEMPRLGEAIGLNNLFVKRDDCTGVAGGGNKTRKLEYVIGRALANGVDTLITTGAIQSNHARQTAGLAARLGLECHLVLESAVENVPPEYEFSGNVLLDKLFGAIIHPAEVAKEQGGNAVDITSANVGQHQMNKLSEELRAAGKSPYIIGIGASSPTGALGYVECAAEIEQQSDLMGGPADWVVHGSGSCGTQAGLVAGFRLMGAPTRVLGVGVSGTKQDGRIAQVEALANETAQLLGHNAAIPETDIHVTGDYVGEGYGIFGDDVRASVAQIASKEGLLIDPVYTGKALTGLIDLAQKGFFKSSDRVVFVHTGGWPGLFAYASCILNDDC